MSGSSSVQLPLATVDSAPPPVTGSIIDVSAGGNLQAAINAAQPGDEIVVQAGAVFTGPITLPNFSGPGWISIVSSALASLPAGQQVSQANVASMATILAPGDSQPALQTAAGAHNYYIAGINFTYPASTTSPQTGGLVDFGTGGETSLTQTPNDLIMDRCVVQGLPTLQTQRGISLQSANTAIVNSWIGEIHSTTQDSQAIAGWNGPGPYLIQNNYLAAAGENILFGGADPSIPNLVPSDITITNNTIIKPLAWQAEGWLTDDKNWLELKDAQRVLINGNTFENNFAGGQSGFGILMWSVNQDGTAPWSVAQNVTFTNNTLINSLHGISLISNWGTVNTPTNNINISNNLMYDIGQNNASGGRLFQIQGIKNLSITNNTAIANVPAGQGYWALGFDGGQNTNLNYSNNVVSGEAYGVWGSGAGVGSAALAAYAPGATFTGNVLIGGTASEFASNPGNYFPSSVGFVNPSTGNYNLTTPSLYDSGDAGDQFIDSIATPPTAPTISGTVAGQATTSEGAVKPFSGVKIADPNSGASDTLTITVAGAGGTLSGTGLSGGTGGVYTLTGTAATVTSELEALSFTPKAGAPNTTSTTTFKLSDLSSAYATATVNTTTSVVDTDPAVDPTVAITSAGGTTSSSAQTITGTVDVADAGSTVTVLDGTTTIGTATVAANGAWSDNVTLANQGANVVTATDTNAAGTGTSNTVTYTLRHHQRSVGPMAAITSAGGTTDAKVAGTGTSNVVADALQSVRSDSLGSLKPGATGTITASDSNACVSSVSAPQTITVIDPPPAPASMLAPHLLASELLTIKRTEEAGLAGTENYPQFATSSSNLAALLTSDGRVVSYNLSPAFGETYLFSGLNIAASHGEIGSAGSRAL